MLSQARGVCEKEEGGHFVDNVKAKATKRQEATIFLWVFFFF